MNIEMREKIFVTKSFMPAKEEYFKYIDKIYENGLLTNQGPLLKDFEAKISSYLDVDNFHYVTNGTIALQIALKASGIESGEIITTPFSYVATVSSILWQRCNPVFVDIEADNFMIDPDKIESAITDNTRAIMPVHVFGYACDIEKIQAVADKYNLKVIYDAAHAFGTKYKGQSVFKFGDISTLSFHATKLFHTIEGGACVVKDKKISEKIELIKRFGHNGDNHYCLGINAKQSEFNAAMGLANFSYIDEIISKRKVISELYDSELINLVKLPKKQKDTDFNYAYYPVVFKSEDELLKVFKALNNEEIYPRRYFYPSLNTLSYLNGSQPCPTAEDICSRIACLPLYPELKEKDVLRICGIIKGILNEKIS